MLPDTVIYDINNYFKQLPVEKAWLFGSYARNEETENSDIDILVTFTKPNNISLMKFIMIIQNLEVLSNKKIDLVVEGTARKLIAQEIEKEKKLIYERN